MNFMKLSAVLLACTLFSQANADEDVDYYENAFLDLHQEYEFAYEALNKQIGKCSGRPEFRYGFSPVVKKYRWVYPKNN